MPDSLPSKTRYVELAPEQPPRYRFIATYRFTVDQAHARRAAVEAVDHILLPDWNPSAVA